jgi:predicted nucleic acid-binding protein
MIVVADSSPLNYLILIGVQHVLPSLYQRVVVPEIVRAELTSGGSPVVVRDWLCSAPSWIEVHSVATFARHPNLHAGEDAAIALAKTLRVRLLLVDDLPARRVAVNEGLQVTGTLGILRDASIAGLIDLPQALGRLQSTNFRADPALLKEVLNRRTDELLRE